jgi:hypothetical protein
VFGHRGDVLPGVAEHFFRLTRHRQEHVHGRVGDGAPGADEPLVRAEVEAAAQPVGDQGQGQEQRAQQHERADDPEPVVLEHEPDLAEQQQREAGQREQRQHPRVAPYVLVLLVIARR